MAYMLSLTIILLTLFKLHKELIISALPSSSRLLLLLSFEVVCSFFFQVLHLTLIFFLLVCLDDLHDSEKYAEVLPVDAELP